MLLIQHLLLLLNAVHDLVVWTLLRQIWKGLPTCQVTGARELDVVTRHILGGAHTHCWNVVLED